MNPGRIRDSSGIKVTISSAGSHTNIISCSVGFSIALTGVLESLDARYRSGAHGGVTQPRLMLTQMIDANCIGLIPMDCIIGISSGVQRSTELTSSISIPMIIMKMLTMIY